MFENLLDHRGLFDGSDDADPALAARTGLDVIAENSLQEPCPVHALLAGWVDFVAVLGITLFTVQLRNDFGLGNDLTAVFVVRSQYTRIPRQVNPWPWNQGRKSFHEL